MANLTSDSQKISKLPTNLEVSVIPRPVVEVRPMSEFAGQARTGISNDSIVLDFWRAIRRRWRLVCLIAIAGELVSLVITMAQTPKFRAFALLEVRSLNSEFMDMKTTDPTASGLGDPAETDVQTQVKIIESEPVMIRTIDRVDLYVKNRQSETQNYWSGMWSSLGLGKPKPYPSTVLLKDVVASIRVRPVGPTRIIRITADSEDPFIAQLFINVLADEYRAQTAAAREINSSATGVWLASQLKELQSNLEKAQVNLEQFARANSLMFLGDRNDGTGPSVAQQRLQEMQVDLARAEADRIAKQSAVEQTSSPNLDSLPPVLDNGPIRDYELKLADLRRQLAEVSSTLKPSHPTVVKLQNQINELTSTVEREKRNVLGRMRTEYQAAQRREALLSIAFKSQEGRVNQQGRNLVRYTSLLSEVQSNQKLYEAMQRKVTEAHIADALHASPIRLLNPAMLPKETTSPNWLLNLLGGLAASLLAAVCAAFFSERIDNRIRTPGEIASHLALRELGAIPNAQTAMLHPADERLSLIPTIQNPGGIKRPTLLSDSFRSVVQSVLFAGAEGVPIGLISVSSPEPGDGKSSVVSNLAQALSELNKKILLLDCDLRRPSLHKIFSLPNEKGISDLLAGDGNLDSAAIQKHILLTKLRGISLLPAGAMPDSIPLTLTGDRMSRLLAFSKESFDMVIVDCPPLLQGPDARIMGRSCDGLILVVRAGKTSFTAAQDARAILNRDNIPVLGLILNDWNPRETPYYSSYRSYYEKA